MDTSIDPQALALTHSIALAESGNGGLKPNYSATGDAGTSKGAYQWQPGNFEAAAKNAGLDPNDFSPENQDKVAYSEVKGYKDKGYDPGEIASLWNSGSPNNYKNHSGTTTINGKEISYDTPAYVKKVQGYYNQLYKPTNGVPMPDVTGLPSISTSSDSTQPGGIQGLIQGAASPITRGLSSIAGIYNAATGNEQGAKDIEDNGIDYGYFGTQKPIGTGFDVSKGISDNAAPLEDAAKTGLIGGAEVAGGTLAKAGVSGLAGLLNGGTALGSDVSQAALTSVLDPGESVADLSAVEKTNALSSALKSATASGNEGEAVILRKAISEVSPQVLSEAGIGPSALGGILKKGGTLGVAAIKALTRAGLDIGGLEVLKDLLK